MMKIAMIINGTRGDVQPMIALAAGLMKNNHEVVVYCPPENEELVKSYCSFVPFGPDYRKLFKENAKKIKSGATVSPSPKQIKRDTENQINRLPSLLKGYDLVLGVGFVLGVHTVADMLKIPYRFVIFYPALLGPAEEDKLVYRMLFDFGKSMTNMTMKGLINNKRKVAGLPPVHDVWSHWMGEEVIVACDKEINAVRPGVGFKFVQTAFMNLPAKTTMPGVIEEFLNQGKPPVFIGFGSVPIAHLDSFKSIIEDTVKATHQRFIISKGWANLTSENLENVLYVDESPFELLFPRLSAIIFHGGTGTMALAARAGIPQAAFPFMADQFENQKQIIRLGIGPKTADFKKMTSESLTAAVLECISNEQFRQNASALALKLKDADGVGMTMSVIEAIR